MPTLYKIRDAGKERRFYSQIPHMIDDAGLSAAAFRLYVHLKRVTGSSDEGACWESTSTLAKSCNCSTPTIVTAKKELLEAGLIEIEERPGEHGNFPSHLITIVNVWEINDAMYNKENRENLLSPDDLYKKFIWDDIKNLYGTVQKIYTGLYKNFILKNNHNKNNHKEKQEEKPSSSNPAVPFVYPPAKKEKPAEKQLSLQPVMFGRLVKLCNLDPKLMAARIGKAAKELLAAGYTPEDMDKFGVWWAAEDWRGKKGQAPTLEQIKVEIPRSKQVQAEAEDIGPWSDYPADYEVTEDDQYNGSLDPGRMAGRRRN